MKRSSIIMQALCLATLMILARGGKLPVKKHCYPTRIMHANEILKNKTADFVKLFPDKNISVKLLTDALKNDFMKNCNTRDQLLSFYAQDVLTAGKISAEAKKHGIDHDFLRIEDMLQSCPSSNCESAEVTESMEEFRKKVKVNKTVKVMKYLNKAVSEFDTLLVWINEFTHELKKKPL